MNNSEKILKDFANTIMRETVDKTFAVTVCGLAMEVTKMARELAKTKTRLAGKATKEAREQHEEIEKELATNAGCLDRQRETIRTLQAALHDKDSLLQAQREKMDSIREDSIREQTHEQFSFDSRKLAQANDGENKILASLEAKIKTLEAEREGIV